MIIVTEKLDGSNVGVVRNGDYLECITRAGYKAITSPFKQHHYFEQWVGNHTELFNWMSDKYRMVGE